ncbi:MAG: PorT family protein [Stigonema ocellatum SAG 48.90 = DSM 106950]|nr:PorT family protein [Stigonema ocellatum SAG 48.90 = DSM 106950]
MAQREKRFRVGPKAGLHLTQLVGKTVGTSKLSTHASAGLSAEYQLNSLFALSADVVYSRLGGSYGSIDTSALFKDYKLVMQFDYIHLPLVIRVSPRKSLIFLEAGGQVGVFLSRRVKINDLDGQTQPNQSTDAGWVLGIGQHITKHLCVNFRYYKGLTSIWKPSYYTNPTTGQTIRISITKQVHQSFGLQATYYF